MMDAVRTMNDDKIILKPCKSLNDTILDHKYISNYNKFLELERELKLDKLSSFYKEYIDNRRSFYKLEYKTITILYNIWNYLINHKNYMHLLSDFNRFYIIFTHYFHNNKNTTILSKLKENINENINKICNSYISLLPVCMLKELHEIYSYTKYDSLSHKNVIKTIKNSYTFHQHDNENIDLTTPIEYYHDYTQTSTKPYNTTKYNILGDCNNLILSDIDNDSDNDSYNGSDRDDNLHSNNKLESIEKYIHTNVNYNKVNSVINEYDNYCTEDEFDNSSSEGSESEYYN